MGEEKRESFKAIAQIVLLVGMIFAFSYFMHESSGLKDGDIILIKKKQNAKSKLEILMIVYSILIKSVFSERGFVSAQTDVATCIETNDGKYCQEYTSDVCKNLCKDECIPTTREKVSQCKIGTCFDTKEGTCENGAPKLVCENWGGKWFDDPNGNVEECERGCCIIGLTTLFTTEKRCSVMAKKLGIEKNFTKEITNEIECWLATKTQEEGACIIGKDDDGKNICIFGTRKLCEQKRGEFYPGYLCSNPELNTNCEKQKTSGCVKGKDEIYWFDSCGNRENIYDANKARSWNNGMVLKKEDSCTIGTSQNPLLNQRTCGNCNYIIGSICGNKTATQKLDDPTQNFVCRDLSCIDEWGKRREHGESWCHYQSLTGVSDDNLRAMDTPGARHFVMSCVNGEVRIQPCADYRTEVCRESRVDIGNGKKYSQAACSINMGFQCLTYNKEKDKDKIEKKCNRNSDCYLKNVRVSDFFKFSVCLPKYPLGFNNEDQTAAQMSCGLGTQKCKVLEIKEIDGWKCKANCDCLTKEFAQKMSDLCMSLGDCGGKANYLGTYTKNFRIDVKGESMTSDLKGLLDYDHDSITIREYAKESPDNFIDAKDFVADFAHLMFRNGGTYTTSKSYLDDISKWAGISGSVLGIVGQLASSAGSAAATAAGAGAGGAIATPTAAVGSMVHATSMAELPAAMSGGGAGAAGGGAGAAVAGAAGALAAGILAATVAIFLLKITGVEKGIPPELAYALAGVAFVGGVMLGSVLTGFVGTSTATATIVVTAAAAAAIAWIGFGLIVAVIAFIMIMKFALKVGEVNKITVTYNCYQWQPDFGGKDCSKCGSDGLPCSKYNCESLGKACRFLDESELGVAKCIWADKNDMTGPKIKPLYGVLPKGYNYSDVSDNGFRIVSDEKDECVRAYKSFNFGISLDKVGQCKYVTREEIGNNPVSYEQMPYFFGDSSFFAQNHTMPFMAPSLSSLGITGFNEEKITLDLIVKCVNVNGYENKADYVISMCLKPGEDVIEPMILGHEPINGAVPANAVNSNVTIYISEPSECKWDLIDRDYDAMNNSFDCLYDDETMYAGVISYSCSGVLPVEENLTFYARCKDQPWLKGVNESLRNSMTKSHEIILKKTTPLKIDYVKPYNEEIIFGVEPTTIEISAETTGGVDGNARCSYKSGDKYVEFSTTFGSKHKQIFNSMWKSDIFGDEEKIIVIKCEDTIGNSAEEISRFKLKFDTSAPKITRVYNKDDALYIVTDEKAECVYSYERCDFDYDDGTLMNGKEFVHTSDFALKQTRYVKCADYLGNVQEDCITITNG